MSDWQIIQSLQWYDRNPVSKIYGALYTGISPHTDLERFTYTCAKDKIAMVEVIQVKLTRKVAATTEGQPHVFWTFTPSGGTETKIVYGEIMTNNAGDKDSHALGTTMMLMPGDNVKGYTGDNSVGGSMNYFLALKITEFDANPPKDFKYIRDPTRKSDIQQPRKIEDPPM